MAWPAVERVSGSLIPLTAAYFDNETATFEEVDSQSTHPAMSPLLSRQRMTSLMRMLPMAPHTVSAMSNTLTLVFAGRSREQLSLCRPQHRAGSPKRRRTRRRRRNTRRGNQQRPPRCPLLSRDRIPARITAA